MIEVGRINIFNLIFNGEKKGIYFELGKLTSRQLGDMTVIYYMKIDQVEWWSGGCNFCNYINLLNLAN